VFLVGQDSAVSTLITLTATAMLALHFIVAAMLGGGALFSRYQGMLPEKARA
jgi:hypothetical protein